MRCDATRRDAMRCDATGARDWSAHAHAPDLCDPMAHGAVHYAPSLSVLYLSLSLLQHSGPAPTWFMEKRSKGSVVTAKASRKSTHSHASNTAAAASSSSSSAAAHGGRAASP